MSRLSERNIRNIRDIARELAESESFEPPAGLLDKIKAEIPQEVRVGTAVPGTVSRSFVPRQRWLIAASLVATVGAGLLGLRTWQVREDESLKVEPHLATPPSVAKAAPSVTFPAPPAVPPPPPQKIYLDRVASAEEAPQPPAAPKPQVMPEREQRELRALGYVSDNRRNARPAPAPPLLAVPENRPAPSISYRGASPRAEKDDRPPFAGGVEGGAPAAAESQLQRQDQEAGASAGRLRKQLLQLKEEKAKKTQEEAYDSVHFKSAGTSPFKDAAAQPLSTFGLDVDTGSYTVARRYLTDGHLPDPASVRVEEWVNYFDYGDPAPARGADFAIRAEGAPSPFAQGPEYRLLRFNVKAGQIKAGGRRPVVLTFVVDVSGSMAREDRLGLVKQSLSLLLDQLRPDDRVGLVVFGTNARLLLEPSNDREVIRQAIQRLTPEGSTNTEEGLSMGYDVAGRNFRRNASNRIILCSDGVANVGLTGPQAILGRIGREARRGIELTTLGFGMGNYNDELMEQLADKGEGRYAYIDTLNEARRVLVDELTGTLQTLARNAKAQVEFNSVVVESYRLLGYENRAIPDKRFRDETVEAGQIGAGHSVTALYEIQLRKGVPHWEQPVATLHLRYQVPGIGSTIETLRQVGFQDFAPTWEQASPALRLTALVAELAEILKGSPWARQADLNDVARRIREMVKQLPGNAKAGELADLAEKAVRIKAGQAGPEE